MRFLYPAFLVGALAAAIPVVLHLMRREVAPEVPFSAVRLLKGSPVPRARRRRLRELLLLAARVAALLLLAAAFARRYVMGAGAIGHGLRIVAIDRSLSMTAPGRFAEALAQARRAIDDAPPGERIAVLAFDDRADLIAEPGNAPSARAALARVEPSFGGTRYASLFARASDLAGMSGARLIVISDMQRAGWENQPPQELAAGIDLELRDVGALPPDLAVVRARAEADRVVASIRNTGPQARTGLLRVERDGRVVAATDYEVAGDSVVEVPLPLPGPRTGALTVSVEDPQGLAADNVRFVVVDDLDHAAVIVFSSGAGQSGFYVTRALAAGAAATGAPGGARRSELATFRPSEAARLLSGPEGRRYAAIVLLTTRGLDRAGRDAIRAFVRSGGGILVAASPDVEPAVLPAMFDVRDAFSGLEEKAVAASLSVTDPRHPVFRPFGDLAANLGQVRFDRVWRVRPEGWETAARFSDGTPALLERQEGDGRIVLFTSDIDRRWNDFPVQPSFVPFVVEAVRYISRPDVRAREYLVGSVPPGVPARPGVYQAGPDNRVVAVNVDERESDPGRLAPEEFAAMVKRGPDRAAIRSELQARQAEGRQNYWQYGLLLMIGALVAESFIGRA
jgi:hypothetical protein